MAVEDGVILQLYITILTVFLS